MLLPSPFPFTPSLCSPCLPAFPPSLAQAGLLSVKKVSAGL